MNKLHGCSESIVLAFCPRCSPVFLGTYIKSISVSSCFPRAFVSVIEEAF